MNDILRELKKDIKVLKNKIEHKDLYNLRNLGGQALIKSGLVLERLLPFLTIAIMLAFNHRNDKTSILRLDTITEKANIETLDTSSGIHEEKVSYDYDYEDSYLEHTTGWVINERGFYERTVTSYRLNEDFDLSKIDDIFNMTKDEIENILVVTNIRTISKNRLLPEDDLYNEEAFIVVNHYESEDIVRERRETVSENGFEIFKYLVLILCWGASLGNAKKAIIKTYLGDKLRELEPNFKLITDSEISSLKKLLELKMKNLELLEDKEEQDEIYTYSLRRK